MNKGTCLLIAGMMTVLFASDSWPQTAKPRDPSAKSVTDATLPEQIAAIRELCDARDETGNNYLVGHNRSSILRCLAQAERYFAERQFQAFRNSIETAAQYTNYETARKAFQAFLETSDTYIQAETKRLLEETRAFMDELGVRVESPITEKELESADETLRKYVTLLGNLSSSGLADPQPLRDRLQFALNFVREWMVVVGAEADGDSAKALETVTRLQSSSHPVKVISRKALQKKADVLYEAVGASLTSALDETRGLLAKATTLKTAQDASNRFNLLYQKMSRTSYNHPLRQEIENARQTLTLWLNALTVEESGDPHAALQVIQSLENSGYRHAFLLDVKTLSAKKKTLMEQLLALEGDAADPLIRMVDAHVSKVRTAEDLAALGGKLQTLLATSYSHTGSRQEAQFLLSDIQQLSAAFNSLHARQFGQLFQYPQVTAQYAHRWKPILSRHYQGMCAQAIASLCQLDDLKPVKEGQGIDQALLALADQAAERRDWQKAHLYLETYRTAFFSNYQAPGWLAAEIAATRAFVAAQNFEKADQFAQAAALYMTVLQHVGKRVPTQEAATRLKELKKNHPDALKSAPALPQPANAGEFGSVPLHSGPSGRVGGRD